jgi:hypothetical protein
VVLAVVSIGSAFRFVTVAPNARAASEPFSGEALHGGGAISFCPTHRTDPHCVQDPKFIALKRAGRIGWPGCVAPEKGTQIDPIVLPAPCTKPAAAPVGNVGGARAKLGNVVAASATHSMNSTGRWGNCNDCYELPEGSIWNVFEPSAGGQGDYNFGYGSNAADDNCSSLGCTGTPYFDQYYWDLCGPGAADVALWFWPKPPNTESTFTKEPISQVWAWWKGTDPYDGVMRMRGYMMDLAYLINPGWPSPGMQLSDPSHAATKDWAMREGLNWEASGHQGKDYFYIFSYPDSSGNAQLRSDVKQDLTGTFHAPVVVLLNAKYLPNWSPGGTVGHYVTIIGYNNDNSQYAYVDTCGYWTYCNHGPNTDGQVHVVDQQTLFNGILSYGNEWIW